MTNDPQETDRTRGVLAEEAAFANSEYREYWNDLAINPHMFRMYANPVRRSQIRERAAMFLGPVAGKRLLDYGCGMGEESMYFAKLGAEVTAIDIAPVGIELTRRRAAHNGLDGRVQAFVMDVTATTFPDESFDLVHGLGIIHHVGLEPGLREVKRLLRPGGRAVFLEHMGNSALVEKVIKPRLGGELARHYTDHEKPLKWDDCLAWQKEFRRFELYPFYLLGRLRKRMKLFSSEAARRIDHALLTVMPPLRHFASGILICVEK